MITYPQIKMIKYTTLSILALFSIFLVSSILSANIISAEIIWSLPTEVEFTIIPATPLKFDIISPINKVYHTKNIPIEILANKPASCSYSMDSKPYVFLGNGTNIKKTIKVLTGSHNLRIKCNTNTEEKIKSVDFRVRIDRDNAFNQVDKDNAFEEQIIKASKPRYSEWACINNQLQRIVTMNNLDNIEYGGVCGVELSASQKPSKINIINSWLIILPLIFILLILIAIISIILVMFLRK